jgi:outer membrane immunogenic protein
MHPIFAAPPTGRWPRFSGLLLRAPVGARIEGAIGGNWTAKLEYLYVDLGRVSGSFATANTISAGGVVTTLVLNSNYSSRITDNVLRVGLKFGGPVVAKY